MCGIAGFTWNDPAMVKLMTDSIRHRGPDDEGSFADENITLGHRRLSIIDLTEAGHQPMKNEDGSVIIVYNGEIYNHQELRNALPNHVFRSRTDTEAIIHGYEEWGIEGLLSRLDGMFAFALYDRKSKLLILARDRLGIKQVYFSETGKGLIFASEIKAMLRTGAVSAALNPHALVDYLCLQNVLGSKTFFKGIDILKPGHYAVWESGQLQVKRYWDLTFKNVKRSKKDLIEAFSSALRQSVKEHMLSDVPVGVYLSGGFDSSAVALFASKECERGLMSFTGAFDEGPEYDERERSRMVAEKIGAIAHEKVMTHQDFISSIRKITYHLDEPRVGMGAFPQYHVSKLVSEHVKVVLTGHGGDELFLGYAYFKALQLRESSKRNPLEAIKAFKTGSEIIPLLYHIYGPLFRKELQYGLLILFSQKELLSLLTEEFSDSIKGYTPYDAIRDVYSRHEPYEAIQRLYLTTYLPSLFIVEDKLGMAHSVEARVPFCSKEMIEFATSIPFDDKLANDELKHIVKEALRPLLPEEFFKQKKMGFPTPLSKWFRGPLKGFLYDTLLSDRARNRQIFNMEAVERLVDDHCSGRKDNAHKIWSLLSIELWYETFFDQLPAMTAS